jgi:hypothetical protein
VEAVVCAPGKTRGLKGEVVKKKSLLPARASGGRGGRGKFLPAKAAELQQDPAEWEGIGSLVVPSPPLPGKTQLSAGDRGPFLPYLR